MRFITISLLSIYSIFNLSAQNTSKTQMVDSVKLEFERRIKLTRINDVYIPANTEEAMRELFKLSDSTGRNKMKTTSEDVIASKLHFSLGRWMEINWGFVQGSRLSYYYIQKGLTYIDDMEDLLLRSFYCKVNNLDFNEDQMIKGYIQKREAEAEERRKKLKTTTIHR